MQADAGVEDGVRDVDEDVRDHDAAEANSTMPMITGRSCWVIASIGGLAQPGQAEHGLGDHDAAEELAQVDAELGHDRGERAAQPVPAR